MGKNSPLFLGRSYIAFGNGNSLGKERSLCMEGMVRWEESERKAAVAPLSTLPASSLGLSEQINCFCGKGLRFSTSGEHQESKLLAFV